VSEHETVPAPVTPDDADLYVEAIEDGRRYFIYRDKRQCLDLPRPYENGRVHFGDNRYITEHDLKLRVQSGDRVFVRGRELRFNWPMGCVCEVTFKHGVEFTVRGPMGSPVNSIRLSEAEFDAVVAAGAKVSR